MSSYSIETWIAFLCESMYRLTVKKAKRDCLACKSGISSPLLHTHVRSSFLDLIRNYFEEIRGLLVHDLEMFYNKIDNGIVHSSDENRDKQMYLNIGSNFLLTATPESVYYGRYVDEKNDDLINEIIKNKNPQESESNFN